MKILIIDGPNLNLTGRREPDIYGNTSIEEFLAVLRTEFHRTEIDYFQSNIEGELIDALQRAAQGAPGFGIKQGLQAGHCAGGAAVQRGEGGAGPQSPQRQNRALGGRSKTHPQTGACGLYG